MSIDGEQLKQPDAMLVNYTVSHKKQATILLFVTLPNVDRFSQFFH